MKFYDFWFFCACWYALSSFYTLLKSCFLIHLLYSSSLPYIPLCLKGYRLMCLQHQNSLYTSNDIWKTRWIFIFIGKHNLYTTLPFLPKTSDDSINFAANFLYSLISWRFYVLSRIRLHSLNVLSLWCQFVLFACCICALVNLSFKAFLYGF